MNNKRQVLFRCLFLGLPALFLAVNSMNIARADVIFTSFEQDPPGNFTLGTPPLTATFTGGNAQTVGNFALYHSGTHSWHVSAGTTAVISFETPASAIELFFRNAPDGGPSEVRVINTENMVILTANGTQQYGQVGVNNLPPGTPLIDRIEVQNMGQGADVVVDDVTITADVFQPPAQTNIDISGVTDVSGDAVPDVAGLSQLEGSRPRVRYYSGASRDQVSQVNYLSTLWTGIAAATLADSNQDGVRNDPAVAVLGQNVETGKLFVQVRTAESGDSIAGMSFLSAAWTPVDVVIIDDANGDGVSNDTAIGVLGINPQGSSRRRNLVQVRRLSDGSVLQNVYFANGAWTPLAAGTVPRGNGGPLVAVLLEKGSTRNLLVQARVLSDTSLQRNSSFLNTAWRGKDLAILRDTNGNSVFNDASYMVLAVNPGNGKNVVQIRRPGGTFVKNIFVLTENWQARRIGVADDISGNLYEELGTLGNRNSNGEALIQLKDFDTGGALGSISP